MFTQGEEPGDIMVDISGSIPIIDGYWCICCVDTIHFEPDLTVPLTCFLDIEAAQPPGGLISDHMEVDIGPSTYLLDDATEFIVSGPDGATLTKVGRGFLLVEGDAYLLQ